MSAIALSAELFSLDGLQDVCSFKQDAVTDLLHTLLDQLVRLGFNNCRMSKLLVCGGNSSRLALLEMPVTHARQTSCLLCVVHTVMLERHTP